MDWDDITPVTSKTFALGEDLRTLSIAELEARVGLLEAEIVRLKTETEAKRRQAAAADALFRS